MEDSLTIRLDEVEQELVRLLSLRSDDLQIFSTRQDQLLQSHYHSLTSALQTAQGQLEKLKNAANVLELRKEINERWLERQNLKKIWIYCEEIQRQKFNETKNFNYAGYNSTNTTEADSTTATETTSTQSTLNTQSTINTQSNLTNPVYQTPYANDSNTNISKTSLTNLCDLSLD